MKIKKVGKVWRIKIIGLIFLGWLFVSIGCSSKQLSYRWKNSSATAFSSYTQSFLKDDKIAAKSELKRAIKSAKSSADVEQLASIYLGVCALNNSVGIEDDCKEYTSMAMLVNTISLDIYLKLLNNTIKEEEIMFLPQHYQNFVRNQVNKNYSKAFEEILTMKKITSQLISATLIKEYLDDKQRVKILKIASKYGYKKAVLFWLDQRAKYMTNRLEKEMIKQKILLLESE